MATQFTVKLDDRPGELGKLATALGDRGVDIRGLAGTTVGKQGVIQFLVSDDAAARKALKDAKFAFTERDVLIATVEDRPGALGQLGKNLGSAGASIESLVPLAGTGPVRLAIGVDKPEKAKTVIR